MEDFHNNFTYFLNCSHYDYHFSFFGKFFFFFSRIENNKETEFLHYGGCRSARKEYNGNLSSKQGDENGNGNGNGEVNRQ